jgi:asparagine synthase (glutamine-hydrolysing)
MGTIVPTVEESEAFAELDDCFDEAVGRTLDGAERVSLLYSGGVDSTLVALALRGRRPFESLVIGMPGGTDAGRARSGAASIGEAVREVLLRPSDVSQVLREEGSSLSGLREPARSVQVALALAVRAAPTPRILAGQGADELFGGYAHFRGLDPSERESRREADLCALLERDWPVSRSIASRMGHELRSPFLEEGFVRYARTLPLPAVGADGLTKPLLRRWAVHRGVPEAVAFRPKHAMQYGSGVAGAVRRLARQGELP